jgi:fumarylpyruvate hydrolase
VSAIGPRVLPAISATEVPVVMAKLSRQVTLGAGDLIYTGTSAGVGPVVPGDLITAHIDGLPSLTITITPPEE